MGMIPALLTSTSTRPKTVDGPLDERFHFCALRHIGGKSDGLAAAGRDLLNHCVDPVQNAALLVHNFCSLFCEKLRGAFPNAAAGSGDYYNFVGDIGHPFSLSLYLPNFLFTSSRTPLSDGPRDSGNLFDQ